MIKRLVVTFSFFFVGLFCGEFNNYNQYLDEIAFYILIVVFVLWEYSNYRNLKKTRTYKTLQQYIKEKNAKVNLHIFGNNNCYQGQGIGKTFLRISSKWYNHIQEYPEHFDYVKCVICHELYHIKMKHPVIKGYVDLFLRTVLQINKDKYLISTWHEEFCADRYGCEIFGNKEVFLKCMAFKKENSAPHNPKKKSTHPTWDMRMKYIMENIEPTLERVTKEYKEYYNIL